MNATWFLIGLFILQSGAAVSLFMDNKAPLAGVYLCYGVANLISIWVAARMT